MIYAFNTKEETKLSQVGGKAKSLIEMTAAGFDVPEGFVLSVDFFANWMEIIRATTDWQDFLSVPDKEECDALKVRAVELKLTEEQKASIETALNELKEKTLFAVRSSSPEEDLEDTSFAGQYDSVLGVVPDQLETAIAHAFASMFDTRVVEYKKLNGIPLDNPRIAVIVQKQIASEVSGIAFSLNPANNCYDEAMVSASFGLGEAIVSGQVTPDTFVVDKVKKEILTRKVASKAFGLWLMEDGGTIERINEDPGTSSLDDEQILQVAELAAACEAHYAKPMDIEWAIEEGTLYLLQARPITTYLPLFPELLTEPGEKKNLYIDIMGLTQGFTENLSELGTDFWSEMLQVAKMGIMPEGRDGVVVSLHGRQYIHISNLAKAMGIKQVEKLFSGYDMPTRRAFKSIDFNEYMPKKKTEKTKKIPMKIFKMMLAVGPASLKSVFTDHRKVREDYVRISDSVKLEVREDLDIEKPFTQLIDESLLNVIKLIRSAGMIMAGMTALSGMKKLFKGQDVEDLVISMGMDLDGNPTSAMGHYMFKLASYEEIKNTSTGEEFAERIGKRDYTEEFLADYDEYMVLFGARGFKEIDIAAQRSYEDLPAFFNQLAHINTEDNRLLDVKERRKKAYDKLLGIAKQEGFEKKFVKLATKYQETFGYREDPKFVIVLVTDQLRRVALILADQFVVEGRLANRDQIFDLTAAEISRAQRDSGFDMMGAREENLAHYVLPTQVKNWPNIIDSRGKIIRDNSKGEDGDIVGDPIAPGKVTGRAKVLHSPYEKQLESGEILVTKATEPAWTPVFVNAAGVVLEVGGPLQHGAIIAREYGIPCVSGVADVQNLIKDGDLIEVDGSRGIVRILEDSGAY
jgi:pyruvate,water dikinase